YDWLLMQVWIIHDKSFGCGNNQQIGASNDAHTVCGTIQLTTQPEPTSFKYLFTKALVSTK
ncbi:MAG: hypothetical protein L0287_31320, partial [Anaerolineae bacterium]|nr:hypothetical protein [Anaerolineae bacterium]